eukprot:gene15112-16668_t
MAGLLNRKTNSSLPLRASSVWTDVRGFTARTTANLTYYNDHRLEVNGLFVFPLEINSQVVEFEANVEGRYVFVDIKSKEDSEVVGIYDDEVRNDDLFSICIGKLPPWILIDIQVTIVTEIAWLSDKQGLKLSLPSVFTPRVVQDATKYDESKNSDQLADFPAVSTLGYSLQIEVNIEAPCLLAEVSSTTFPLRIDAVTQDDDASKIRVTLPDDFKHCDKDFELLIYLAKPHDPFIYIEQARQTHTNEVVEKNPISNIMNNSVLMLSYCPDSASVVKDTSGGFATSEFIFMIDRSGSMNGNLINNAKQAILLFLHSLPSNSYFNVISFGTYFKSLFKESQPYSQLNLEDACNHVRRIRGDMGGTSLLEPLEWIFNQPLRKTVPRQIFMVTDGMVMDANHVVECVRRHGHNTRVFTFGLGANICKKFLRELANATRGNSEIIAEGDRLQRKVIEKVHSALQPALTNIRASWILPDGYDVVYTPEHIPCLFDGDRLSLYAILARRHDLDTTSNGKRSQETSTGSVKEFWFEEDEFDVELICDEQSEKDSKSIANESNISHESLVYNPIDPDELRLCPETEDGNDSEVFLTEEEAECISESYTWQYRKRSSIDRVQSWKVSRNPDSIEADNALGVPIYENQWCSAERLVSRSASYRSAKENRFSASTGDIRRPYCGTTSREGGNESFDMAKSHDQCLDSVHRFLGHPGFPTRHNSARSNEGRSPIQKSCTEFEMFSETGPYCNSNEMIYMKPTYHDHIRTDPSESTCNDDVGTDKRHDVMARYPKLMPSFEEEYGDLREYNIDALRKEARRLKQSLSDDHVNTHFIDESNFKIICNMINLLVIEKRRRLLDFVTQQEEFVKCNWEKGYEKHKQFATTTTTECDNRRDSGLGNRSSSEPKSDHEEEYTALHHNNRLEPQRGIFSVASSGYFEPDRFAAEEKRQNVIRQTLYKRQISDECRSDKSGKSNLSTGRPKSATGCETSSCNWNNKQNIGCATEPHTTHYAGHTRSVGSDCASGKSRTSLHSGDNHSSAGKMLAGISNRKLSDNSDSRLSANSDIAARRSTPGNDGDRCTKWMSKDSLTGGKAMLGSQTSPLKSPGLSGTKSVFSSFIDGVKSLASRLSEKSTENLSEKPSSTKTGFQGIFSSKQNTLEKRRRSNLTRSSEVEYSDNENSKKINNKMDNLKRNKSDALSKEVSFEKASLATNKDQVKRQSSMRYTKPILERSRTISSSFVHDLGDGEEITGDNVTLNPNQGLVYLSGCVGKRIFKRLIPFKLAFDQDSAYERSKEPTIHQLGAKSILRDLEQQMEDDTSLDASGKDYIAKLIGQVSRSARIPSKYTSMIAIDDECEEGQALCIRRFGRKKSRTLSSQKNKPDSPSNDNKHSPPLYEIQRQEIKQIEIGNKTQKVMTTKLTLFTPKPRVERSSLLSPVSASRHTLMVQKRLFDSSGYMRMIDIQTSDGFWYLNEDLAEAIPAPMAKLKQCCPFVDQSFKLDNESKLSNKEVEVGETNDKIWATSLALKWLYRLWSQYEDEWSLVDRKAKEWLKMQKKPTGFDLDDINLMAKQSLSVLIVNSRRSSCY